METSPAIAKKLVETSDDSQTNKVKITSNNFESINKFCEDIFEKLDTAEISHTGLTRLPTKRLNITTRRSPCGNGSNTYEKWTMRVYKRIFNCFLTTEQMAFVANIKAAEGVSFTTTVQR